MEVFVGRRKVIKMPVRGDDAAVVVVVVLA